MLDVSRIETGRQRLTVRPSRSRSAAQAAIARAPTGDSSISWEAGLYPRPLATRPGSATLSGSPPKRPDRDAVRPPIRIVLGASHHLVSASVKDLGTPVPDDAVSYLFDLSYVYPAAADRREGLGLGLFVARSIAQSLHGDVRYQRPEGGADSGNCFVLAIPRARPEPLPFSSE